jgi:hypothetical protein
MPLGLWGGDPTTTHHPFGVYSGVGIPLFEPRWGYGVGFR